MKWLPPKSLAARSEWAQAHPWIAGCYFGLLLSAFLTVPIMIRTGLGPSVLVGIVTWFASGALFALLSKRRWGERPDAENYPAPTARRMWSRLSDRSLLGFVLLGSAAAISWLVGLVGGSDNPVVAALGLGLSVWLASTSWAERQRRRNTP